MLYLRIRSRRLWHWSLTSFCRKTLRPRFSWFQNHSGVSLTFLTLLPQFHGLRTCLIFPDSCMSIFALSSPEYLTSVTDVHTVILQISYLTLPGAVSFTRALTALLVNFHRLKDG
uniref:Uncharacterized protein n=1 Tax=Anguilla anguilla TaxID=7936 RepID=A0A0E9X0C1_ANGAN